MAKAARKTTLIKFFNLHNSRYPRVNEKRVNDIKKAVALTDDSGVIEPNRILIELLVPQLKLLIDSVMRMDDEIKKYYKNQDDRLIFDSFPGAGPQLHLAYLSPLVLIEKTIIVLQKYKNTLVLHRLLSRAVKSHGHIGDIVVRSFYDKLLLNGLVNPYVIHFGQELTMSNKSVKVNRIIR